MTPEERQKYIDEAARDGLPMAQALQSPQNKNQYYDWLIENGFNQNLLLNNEELARMLKAFEGTDFWDRARMNPYLNFTRNHGALDSFMGLFGASSYDRAMDEQIQAAAEYFSRLQNEMDQQSYDTPVAQASRMAAAGQNPSLLGTSGVSEAQKMDLPITSPDLSQGPGISDFVNVVTGAISMAFSMAKDMKSLQALNLENQGKEISNVASMQGFVEGLAGIGSFDNDFDATDMGETANPFKSGRNRKLFKSSWEKTWHSLKAVKERNENFVGASDAAGKAAKQVASKFFADPYQSPFTNSVIFEDIALISDKTTELMLEVDRKMARLKSKQADNQMAYENSIDPSLRAEAENAANKENRDSATVINEINAKMRQLVEDLHYKSQQGDWFASLLLTSISVFRMSQMKF